MASLSFSPDDSNTITFEVVKDKFDSYFIGTRNVIYERARFNQRQQQTGESVDAFVTDLYKLVEYCEYEALKDDIIRDRIVVGLRDEQLSEKLQLDAKFTLKRAVDHGRQKEAVRKQQTVVRSSQQEGAMNIDSMQSLSQDGATNVDAMQSRPYRGLFERRPRAALQQGKQTSYTASSYQTNQPCRRCGRQSHQKQYCPAKDAKCHQCSKTGHFASKKLVQCAMMAMTQNTHF